MAMYANVNGASKLLAQTSAEAGGGSWSLISSATLDNNNQTNLIASIPTGYEAIKYTAHVKGVDTSSWNNMSTRFRINFNSIIDYEEKFNTSGIHIKEGEYPSAILQNYNTDSTGTVTYIIEGDSCPLQFVEISMNKTFLKYSFLSYYSNKSYIITPVQDITDPVTDLFTVVSSFGFYVNNGCIEKGSWYYLEGLK